MPVQSLSKIRSVLIAQHDEIRAEIAAAKTLLGTPLIDRPALRDTLDRLVTFLRRHNNTEEDALRNVLPGLDAFGPVRKGVMISDHIAEHEDLHGTLLRVGAADTAERIAELTAMLDRLFAHMEHEENLFLNPKLFDGA